MRKGKDPEGPNRIRITITGLKKIKFSRESAWYKNLTLFRAGVREDNQDLPIQGHMVPAVQGQFIIRLLSLWYRS
jgi:hypothetical protein